MARNVARAALVALNKVMKVTQTKLQSARTFVKNRVKVPRKSLWQRIMDKLIMDGPPEWDMHPEVLAAIERERRNREI